MAPGADPCTGVICPAGTACRGGVCVDVTCEGVICPAGSRCEGGVCVPAFTAAQTGQDSAASLTPAVAPEKSSSPPQIVSAQPFRPVRTGPALMVEGDQVKIAVQESAPEAPGSFLPLLGLGVAAFFFLR